MKLKAFTLAEALLTMTILGIIAATMVTVLKPTQFRAQGYTLLKKKTYASLDEITQTIMADCTKGATLRYTYENCDKTKTPAQLADVKLATLYSKYLRSSSVSAKSGTVGDCYAMTDYAVIELTNRVCVYFKANGTKSIMVDVNGAEGPTSALVTADTDDIMYLSVDSASGISTAMPK